ncbi:hypothetical protein R0137_07975 [Congregibacter brevis]|uniref:Uncharacterized protein n=1 Tax=Congregibacter brevis TaxID=3081201 RepID=A0ABZ0IG49_9GAMM|nr:hypothetical protein R0137_07975 [Congregibacter sp. IMCC45268]
MSVIQSLTNRAVFQSLRSTTLAITGSACTIGGLVADVLQPVAPFASYLFVIAAFAFVILLIIYWRGKEELLGAVAFSGVAAGVFGLIVLFQSSEGAEENGFVASTFPGVAELQASLGIIDQKLDGIYQDTQSLRESADRIEDNQAQVMRTLEEMRATFASGGLIDSPRSPEDHYHNARLQELGGDYSAARRSYISYFASDLPLLDPHLRFLAFLKVQEGTAGARETYMTLMAGKTEGIPAYVRLILLDARQRVPRLEAYAAENPDFAPTFYHLSEEVSERRLGFQTLANKRAERDYLAAFQSADEAGGLLKHMIDQSLVEEWRNDASMRLTSLNTNSGSALNNPVSISFGVNNSGYTATLAIAEPVVEVLWNQKDGEARSTGESGALNPQTGKPVPQMFFNLPANQGDTTIEIRYRDRNGALQGPFDFPFKGQQESKDANQRILESTTTSWVSFRDYDGKRLLYFTHLMSYRGSIKIIQYGLNSNNPTKRFRFPAWRKAGMAPIDAKTPMYKSVPRSTRYVTVQLTYKDGSKSAIQRFDYPG